MKFLEHSGLASFLLSKEELPFELPTFELTVSVNPQAGGFVAPLGGSFLSGTQIPLTATAFLGYEFDRWVGASGGRFTTITMDSDKHVTAYFKKFPTLPPFPLSFPKAFRVMIAYFK